MLTSLGTLFKSIITNSSTGNVSSRRFVFIVSSLSLCIGFLISTIALICGVPVDDTIILGLGGIVAGLAGSAYTVTKHAEIKGSIVENKSKQDTKE